MATIRWPELTRLPGDRCRYAGSDGFELDEDQACGELTLKQCGERRFTGDSALLQIVLDHPSAMLTPGTVVDCVNGIDRVVVGRAKRSLVLIDVDRVDLPLGHGRIEILDSADIV